MLGGSDGVGSRGFVTRMVGLAMWLKGLRASDGRVFRLVDVASLVGLVGQAERIGCAAGAAEGRHDPSSSSVTSMYLGSL